jgi:hypothetical protein
MTESKAGGKSAGCVFAFGKRMAGDGSLVAVTLRSAKQPSLIGVPVRKMILVDVPAGPKKGTGDRRRACAK